MNSLKSIWNWVVYSSQNPAKISLTLKGAIPFLLLLGFGDEATLGLLSDNVSGILVSGAQFVTGVMALWGLLRKLFGTAK